MPNFQEFCLGRVGILELFAQAVVLIEKLVLRENFQAISSSLLVIGTRIVLILLIISSDNIFTREFKFHCLSCVIKSVTLALQIILFSVLRST